MSLLEGYVIPFAFPGLPRVRCAFTTRLTGNVSLHPANLGQTDVSQTHAARQRLFTASGGREWTELRQVHGDAFLVDPPCTHFRNGPGGPCEPGEPCEPCGPDDQGCAHNLEADGHATSRPGHVLCIKTADCQPILLAHPAGYVAAVHAGWRGNVLAFPRSSVARFCEAYGLKPPDVRAVRGPSLGYAEFTRFDAEWPASFAPWYDRATRRMDLWRLTRDQLLEAGLLPGNIHGLDLCTYSLNDTFFSYRKGDCGRQAGLIWMEAGS